MWTLIWDTIGYFMDNVPRWAKISLLALLALAVFFFFGYRATIYTIGGIFWFMFLFLVIAHIIVFRKSLKEQKEAAPPPLTPGDQEDISEFQEAMLQEVGPESPMQTLTSTPANTHKVEPTATPGPQDGSPRQQDQEIKAGQAESRKTKAGQAEARQGAAGAPPTNLPFA